MENTISCRSVVVAAREQVSCDLAGEAAILNLKEGMYYGLDAVGARIWSLIQEPRALHEVRDTLLREYEVEPERCERDLLALIEKLSSAGLVEMRNEPAV